MLQRCDLQGSETDAQAHEPLGTGYPAASRRTRCERAGPHVRVLSSRPPREGAKAAERAVAERVAEAEPPVVQKTEPNGTPNADRTKASSGVVTVTVGPEAVEIGYSDPKPLSSEQEKKYSVLQRYPFITSLFALTCLLDNDVRARVPDLRGLFAI